MMSQIGWGVSVLISGSVGLGIYYVIKLFLLLRKQDLEERKMMEEFFIENYYKIPPTHFEENISRPYQPTRRKFKL